MIDQEIKVVEAMEQYGGSFVQALAQCFYRADPVNFLKLRFAFNEYWDQYEKIAFPSQVPTETFKETFNGRGSNIPEGYGDDGYIK